MKRPSSVASQHKRQGAPSPSSSSTESSSTFGRSTVTARIARPIHLYDREDVSDSGDGSKIRRQLILPSILFYVRQRHRASFVVILVFFVATLLIERLQGRAPEAFVSGLKYHPRYIRCLDPSHETDSLAAPRTANPSSWKIQRLDLNMEVYPSKRQLEHVSQVELAAQTALLDSRDYRRGRADEFETDECRAQYDWQRQSYPTCNTLYEVADLTSWRAIYPRIRPVKLVTHGYWRDVWRIRESPVVNSTKRVLKTLRYEHDWQQRNYDRHRRDAVAMERLTPSPHVVNIYGYCGNSGLFEYAPGGDIVDQLWPHEEAQDAPIMKALEKLEIATMVAMGIADVHNFAREGVAAIAHTDITPGQFVKVGDRFKLNDFNRARFIRWRRDRDEPCGYTVGRNPGKNRSPEEYKHRVQSEKVDIYSMGNIFYMLLSGMWPFEDLNEKEAQKAIMRGERPEMDAALWNSTDPIISTLRDAMTKSHIHDPTERATAREIEHVLLSKLKEYKPNILDFWGIKEYHERKRDWHT